MNGVSKDNFKLLPLKFTVCSTDWIFPLIELILYETN